MTRTARRKAALALATLVAGLLATWLRTPQQAPARGSQPEQHVEALTAVEGEALAFGAALRRRVLRPPVRNAEPRSQADPSARTSEGASRGTAAEQAFDEDQGMNAYDNTPEQAEWRDEYASEHTDEGWTTQMKDEVLARATVAALQAPVRIDNLECHETVCRMYLQFRDQHEADAYMAASHPAHVRYEYQSLDPHFDGKGVDASHSMFEVLVKRLRPEGLPRHDAPRAEEDELAITANVATD